MFKKLMSAVAAAALCVSLAACGATATSEAAAEATATPAPAVTEAPAEETASAETADGALRVAGLKGPTTMGLVNLMAGKDAADYDFEMYGKAEGLSVNAATLGNTYQLTTGDDEIQGTAGNDYINAKIGTLTTVTTSTVRPATTPCTPTSKAAGRTTSFRLKSKMWKPFSSAFSRLPAARAAI